MKYLKKFTTFDDEIIQIEPSDRDFELLTKNNEDNKVKCLALNIALGSKSEFKSIKIHEVYGRVSYKKQYDVKTLDTLSTDLNLAVVQLIKIDTDGHEL
jgi:FkbM family methyltransferase